MVAGDVQTVVSQTQPGEVMNIIQRFKKWLNQPVKCEWCKERPATWEYRSLTAGSIFLCGKCYNGREDVSP